MKDNELYAYFKSKSSSLDEMPSKDLWNRIESNLNNKPTSFLNLNNIILKIIILLTILFLIGVVIFNKTKKPIKKEIIVANNDSVKKKKIIMTYDSIGKKNILPINTVPSKKEELLEGIIIIDKTEKLPKLIKDTSQLINSTTLPLKEIEIKIINDIITLDKTSIGFRKIESSNIIKDSTTALIKPDIIPTKSIVTNNNIIYKTNKELSKEEYKVFVNELMEQNKDSIGKQLIIKAKGFNTQRITIKPMEKKTLKVIFSKKDSIKVE